MSKQPNLIHGYNDSLLLQAALAVLHDFFDDDLEQLNLTVKMTLHDVIISAIHDAGLLPGIVFHGGTCLQRMYNCPRFSEDLDFTNIKPLTPTVFSDFGRDFSAAIKTRLKTLGFKDDQMIVKEPENLAWPGEKEPMVRRWAMRVVVGSRGRKEVVNIELANMPSYDYAPKAFVPIVAGIVPENVNVNIEPLNVIFNDKLIAVTQRPYIKYRDVFDIATLSQKRRYGVEPERLDPDLFLQKMADRDFTTEYMLAKVEEVRKILSSEEAVGGFSSEMSRFSIPGRTVDVNDPEIAKGFLSRTLAVLDDIDVLMREKQEESYRPGPR